MRKKYGVHILWILLLIAFDEFVKFYIVYIKKAAIDVCDSTGQLIHFHPTYNEAGNALYLKTGLEFSHVAFMFIAIVGSVAVVWTVKGNKEKNIEVIHKKYTWNICL